jgi:hypothetical protein
MPFHHYFDIIYRECIIPACLKSGITAIRADEILDPGSVPEQIYDSIRDSLFIIADISEQNDNVFYELGYAHALKKKTLLLSNRQRTLPFDVRFARTIIYNTNSNDWIKNLEVNLRNAIQYLYNQSELLKIDNLKFGQEVKGHMHTITGSLYCREPFRHFWFFARRQDLDVWWPQDNGQVNVQKDGSWRAQLFLGVEDREEDIDRFYDVKFGLVDIADNRSLMEYCCKCLSTGFFPGIRHLPKSFEELSHITLKRIK